MQRVKAATGARIVVFGTGECARRMLTALKGGIEAIAASDNNARMWGQRVSGVPIVTPAQIPALVYDYVVVCSTWAADIVPALRELGIAGESILSLYPYKDDDAHCQRDLAILDELVDLTVVGVAGVRERARPAHDHRRPLLDRFVAACHHLASKLRDGRWWYRWFRWLPIDRRIALFDSYWGDGYSCNPRAISEYLATASDGRRWKIVWGFTTPSSINAPRSVLKVKRLGVAYHYYAARAGMLVSNVNFPDHIAKRPGSLHIQTMHGTPIKTLGLDIPGEFATDKARTSFLERCGRWDYLTAPGEYTAGIARRAFQFAGPVLPFGYPRNDYLFSGNTSGEISRVRRSLAIPEARRVLLFAPTWRPTGDRAVSDTTRAVLDCYVNDPMLSEQYVLLVRFHHLMKERVSSNTAAGKGHVIDVSDHPDNRELMLAADALITDYSSIVFDYALLERPIALCCLDYERYAKETRGVYIDIVRESPWPVYQTASDLKERLRDGVMHLANPEAHRRFVAKYGEWEHGHACTRLYDEVILPWAASPGISSTALAPVSPNAAPEPSLVAPLIRGKR
jgi:CDP-glycerol glycerophosphotransferase (TagB/SpsB family)